MEKESRPKELPGVTTCVNTGCGKMYVTVTEKDEQPFEVFAYLGKAGSCTKCQCEALTRAVSTSLRYGVPLEEFIDQFTGIICDHPLMFPKKERVLSCPDGIAKALRLLTGKRRTSA